MDSKFKSFKIQASAFARELSMLTIACDIDYWLLSDPTP